MKTKRMIGIGVLVLAVSIAIAAQFRGGEDAQLRAAARIRWKEQAIVNVANRSSDRLGLTNEVADLRAQAASQADDWWIGPNLLLLGNGEFLVYADINAKEDGRIRDLFIARGSDNKWYYSTFHFCVGLVSLRLEEQPASIAAFVQTHFVREFDGKSDECLQQTWPVKNRTHVNQPNHSFTMKPFLPFALLLAAAVAGRAADDGFVPLFNGHDLSNWVNVNCAPETWSVRDGVIHCTGFPTGALRTLRQYENFILEVEWRHLERGGNSGVFIWGSPIAAPGVPFLRGIEVQVLDHGYNAPGKNEWYTTHGDVFPIHGATMQPFGRHNGQRSFPSEERSKGAPEWNHYRVVCTNGVLRLHVNGKEVSGGEECNYRKGYLALESEGAPVEFRNLRVQEFPESSLPDELAAPQDLFWRSLFNGLDLRGWRTNAATAARWQVSGERLRLTAGPDDPEATLWTESTFGDFELIVDYQPPKTVKAGEIKWPKVHLGDQLWLTTLELSAAEPGKYQRYRITKIGDKTTVRRNEVEIGSGRPAVIRSELRRIEKSKLDYDSVGLSGAGASGEFMNLYVRNL